MTCNHFVQLLWEYWPNKSVDGIRSLKEIQEYGRNRGWLEEQDVLFGEQEIERRGVARILHQFLRVEMMELDENDWQEAMQLQDLLDCRTCVNHVAQVYIKGIMDVCPESKEGRLLFGMRLGIEQVEAEVLLERAFHPEFRLDGKRDKRNHFRCKLTYEDAILFLKEEKDALLIDVRDAIEYKEEHLEQAINIPMRQIVLDCKCIHARNDQSILLYCEKGYKSEFAARCLLEQGYQKVVSFALLG